MVNKTITLIVALIAIAVTIGGMTATVIAMKGNEAGVRVREHLRYILGSTLNNTVPCNITQPIMPFKMRRGFAGPGVIIEVSDEFKQKVIEILKSNPNTSNLLANGYNITYIKPIIKLVVQGDGSVTMKATRAIVLMVKPGEGKALAYVNLETGTVEKLVKCEVVIKSSETRTSTTSLAKVPSGTM